MKNESKYKLVVNHVLEGINDGRFGRGDKLPSVNEYRRMFNLSRDTVFAGINELKAKGVIDSIPGVGCFILNTRLSVERNIFLLFNEMNAFKQELYNGFLSGLGREDNVDIQFHNYNRRTFETLLREANGKYTSYVLMPGKFQGLQPLLQSITGRVYLLDHYHRELRGKYTAVAQNFENDTYEALSSRVANLSKYKHICMVQSEAKEPYERYYGLRRFASENGFTHKYLNTLKGRKLHEGELYILVNDNDLVDLLKQAERQHFQPGREFGIISYNDAPLKEILAGGITTLSTDFRRMGRTMASLLDKREITVIDNPWKLEIRKSI